MTVWLQLHPRADDFLGFIPALITDRSTLTVKEQIAKNYAHGGGYSPLPRWKFNATTKVIQYPDDPPHEAVASAEINGETVYVYPSAWVCIVQPDGSFAVTRMD